MKSLHAKPLVSILEKRCAAPLRCTFPAGALRRLRAGTQGAQGGGYGSQWAPVVKEGFSRQTCSYEMKPASNLTEEDGRGSYCNYCS